MHRPAMLVALALVAFSAAGHAKDQDLYCSACHMLVEEARYTLATADPKETIQVGSFRINPDGTQNRNEIPYARSSLHLTEVMESVCENAKDYMQSKRPDRVIFVRQNSRYARPGAVKNIIMGGETTKRLRFACDSIVEEHEDELIKIFSKDDGSLDPLHAICVRLTGACSANQLYDVNEQPPEIDDLHKSFPKGSPKAAATPSTAESSDTAAGSGTVAADVADSATDSTSQVPDVEVASENAARTEL